MYVIYGGTDPVTPAAWTERAIARACHMGDVIQITHWPDKGGRDIPATVAVGWIDDRMKSPPTANDCAAFLATHPEAAASADPRAARDNPGGPGRASVPNLRRGSAPSSR